MLVLPSLVRGRRRSLRVHLNPEDEARLDLVASAAPEPVSLPVLSLNFHGLSTSRPAGNPAWLAQRTKVKGRLRIGERSWSVTLSLRGSGAQHLGFDIDRIDAPHQFAELVHELSAPAE